MTDMVAGADIRGGGETLAEGIAVKTGGIDDAGCP